MLIAKLATPADYDTVMAIWERSVTTTHNFLAQADFEYYQRILPNFLGAVELMLWYDDDKLLGFTGCGEDELAMFFLDKPYVGQGYGGQILDWLVAHRNITKLDVNSQNTFALQFYLRHGFVVASEDSLDADNKPYPISHMAKK